MLHQPIVDGSVPSASDLRRTVRYLLNELRQGRRLVLHCVGGLGRAGTVSACLLRAQGLSAADAIRQVRSTRSGRAIETRVQEDAIAAFDASPLD